MSGGWLRVMRLPQRDWRGIINRDMVGKETRAVVLVAGMAEAVDEDRSVVVRMLFSGT